MRLIVLAVFLLALPAVALADPCEGALPHAEGDTFAGEVHYIVDGDGLCVGESDDPADWIEVRLADFNAPELGRPDGPEARAALERIAMGRPAECVTRRGQSGRVRSWDRVFAVCRIDGQSVGDLMRAAGVAEGGN